MREEQLRLIDGENNQLGLVSPSQALKMAEEAGLDLVLVAETGSPPVCRLMNFSKFVYEQNKRKKDQRKKQQSHRIKELQFHANIDDHDYQIKLRHILDFMEKGHKVKISLRFRGREMAHREIGMQLMERVVAEIGERAVLEAPPRIMGRTVNMLLAPK